MSFFGGGGNDDRNLKVAKVEAEILTEMFNKMSQSCFKKCVVKYSESELSVGEMSCVDRCVGKYMQAQDKIGDVLKTMEQQMIAQQQQQQGMMPRK